MLNDKKIIAADYAGKDIEGIEGDYVAGQSTTLKRRFDALSKEVIAPKHNELIDELQADSAAAEIGATPLNSNSGDKVQDILEYLWEQMQRVTQGAIPDGSITAAKFADGSITNEKLADNAVTGEKISTGAVGADEIAVGAIGEEKLAQALAEKLAAFVTDGTFQEALLEKAARIHQHAPSDITDTMPIEKGGTGAETTEGALANLKALGMTYHGEEETVDLNDLVTLGIHFFQAGGNWSNIPSGSNGWLFVLPDYPAGINVKQIWLRMGSEPNQHTTCVRTIYGFSGTISDWATLYTTQNPPTQIELGIAWSGMLHTHPNFTTGMTTFDFVKLMPVGSVYNISANANSGTFSDAPTSFAMFSFSKGASDLYVIGICSEANTTTPKYWKYSQTSTSGKWAAI